jgi:DNA-binding beta-propeller fold protein YncE
MRAVWIATLGAFACTAKGVKPSPMAPTATAVALPEGAGGIGFDDMGFARDLHKVIVPAGRTGNLVLIDPATRAVTAISGFTKSGAGVGHGDGTTSADEGAGLLFASDRSLQRLDVIDPSAATIVAEAPLAGGPDYVRYVAATREIWVTEPSSKQIEVFSLPSAGASSPTSAGLIKFDDGPESLVIDNTRSRAYTHQWGAKSHAVDVKSRKIIATWDNGCSGSRGIALDEKRGFLFVGCEEGKAVVLDVEHDGRVLGSLSPGVSGVDIIAYSESLGHLYMPGESSATLAIIGVSASGALSTLAIAPAASGSHCASTDDRGNVWVCDPERGQVLVYADGFAASQ